MTKTIYRINHKLSQNLLQDIVKNPLATCIVCGEVVHVGEGIWEVRAKKFVVVHENHRKE